MLGIYVNDCLIVNNDETIGRVIVGLKQHKFGVKVEELLSDYLSCRIYINCKKKVSFVMQPYLVKGLADKFQEEVNNLSTYGAHGTPRLKIVKSNEEIQKTEAEKLSRYCSGVGMLLY